MVQIKVINTPNIQPFEDIDFSVSCLHRMTNFTMRQPIEVLQTITEMADTMPDFMIVQIQTVFEKEKLLDRLQEKQLQSPKQQVMRDKYVEFLRTQTAIPSAIDQFYLLTKTEDFTPIYAEMRKLGFTMEEVSEEEARAIVTAPLNGEG